MAKTLHKAFGLLEALARSEAPQRVSDLAHQMGMSESSTCRLLGSLVELGYAERDRATSRYNATLKLWAVSQALVGRSDELQAIAEPALAKLSAQTGESCALGIFDDGYSVYVSKADGSNAIRAVATVGARLPATATGFGKAILAWRPELIGQALERVHRFTAHTLTSRRDIERDLDDARGRGYVITRNELHDGVCAIGVPVFDANGVAVAGIALWGAEEAILGQRLDELARETLDTARSVSTRLGYVQAYLPESVHVVTPPASARKPSAA